MKNVNVLTSNGVNVDKSLEWFGDMEMYEETLHDFLDGVEEKMSKLKQFKESGDLQNYAIMAHSLKSDARYLGFTKLAEVALAHEMAGKENNRHLINENFNELINETIKIINVVKQYFGSTNTNNVTINTTENKSSGNTILVVDDSDIIRNFIRKIFSEKFNIVSAKDGAEAINIVKHDYDNNIIAMLLDLNMPLVDGYEVLDYLKENNLFNKIPVSIITGEDSKEKIDATFKYPIVDVIVKPFNEFNIKSVVEKTINSK